MAREREQKIDKDATSEQHLQQLNAEGQAYLARATKQELPPPTRQRVLAAALKYLESRSSHTVTTQSYSQAASQSLNSVARPTSAFQTLLASLLDQTIAPHCLIEACACAADFQLAPILVKCLFILAAIGPINDHKALSAIRSQTQQEDEDLFGDDENRDPQRQSQLQPNQIAVRRTGQSFVDEFVSQLAETPKSTQSRSSAVFVASVAREAPLSETAAQNVLAVLTKRMSAVQLLELPAFLYQLLLFASSRGTPAAKGRVLLHIADVFSRYEKTARITEALSQTLLAEDEDAILPRTNVAELRQVQGTALLHIEYAVKHDPSLSAELIKLAKAGVETPRHLLTSFGTGIVLSLSRTASVTTDVLSMLREVMVRFDRERNLRDTNLYMARVAINDDELLNLRGSLLHIAESTCEIGWDFVKESLLEFAFVLLDKPLPSSRGESCKDPIAEPLIFKLFNAHSSMRESILEQLTTRIALQEKAAPRAISIISKLSDRIPFYVLEHSRFIRDGIELFVSLPPWMAADLMAAYRPLLLARPELQDYFQLVIRKSLFHRDTSSRAVAIKGFLMTVSLCGSSRSGRRDSVGSTHSGHSDKRHENEISGVMETVQPLRRVFSYSAALKAYWYMNTTTILRDPGLKDSTRVVATASIEILKTHLLRFIDGEHAPYLLVEHCVNEEEGGKLIEPLGDLIWALAVAELVANPQNYAKESCILDLARKVSLVSYQDFPFLKGQMTPQVETRNNNDDFEEGDSRDEVAEARANRNKARALGSIAEALLNSVMLIPSENQEWRHYNEIVVPLLLLKEKLFTLLRNAGVGSVADAFDDLGSDLNIERLKPGMKMQLQRGGKSSSGGKKANAGRKSKNGEPRNSSSAGNLQVPKHRFGVFNVLSSASSRPSLPFKVAVQILDMISKASCSSAANETNPFSGKLESTDCQELKEYLFAVAKRHIEDFISGATRASRGNPGDSNTNDIEIFRWVRTLAGIAMDTCRAAMLSTPEESRSTRLKALQIVESCTSALRFLGKGQKKVIVSFCKALRPLDDVEHGDDNITQYEIAIEAIEKLAQLLLDESQSKEGMVTLQIYNSLLETIVPTIQSVEMKATFLNKRIQWAVDLVAERKIEDAVVVKTLIQTCLVYTENNNDLRRAGQVSQRLLKILGDCDENADPPLTQPEFKLCNAEAVEQLTSLSSVDAVLDVLERALSDVEWCIGRMVSLETAANTGAAADAEGSHPGKVENDEEARGLEETAKQAIRAEDAAQIRLEGVVRTLSGLAKCAIGKWAQQERLLRLITRTYKLLSSVTQAQTKRRGDPRTSFVSLINECKGLAPSLWTYLAFVAADVVGERTRKGASKAAKEARVMPQLVYEVERFEKVLIGAQKKTKISLLRGMRRNIARDFRIREDRLHDEEDDAELPDRDGTGVAGDANIGNNQLSRKGKRRRIS